MWFVFGLITLILAVIYNFYRKSSGSWKGKQRRFRDIEFVQKISTHKGHIRYILVGIDGVPKDLSFSFKKESIFDRICKKVGLSHEFQTGNSEFDNLIYLVSDSNSLNIMLKYNQIIINITPKLFNSVQKHHCSITSLVCLNGRIWVKIKPKRKFENSAIGIVSNEVAPYLDKISSSLITSTVKRSRAWTDPFVIKAAMILALSSGLAINGGIQLGRIWFIEIPFIVDIMPLVLDSLAIGLLLTFIAIILTLFTLRRSARTHLVLVELLIVGLFGITSTMFAFMRDYNIDMDLANPTRHEVTLYNKWVERSSGRRSSGPRYYLRIDNWVNQTGEKTVRVSHSIYSSVEEDDLIEIIQKPGYLKYPWVESISKTTTATLPVSANQTAPLIFNSSAPKNDLVGSLAARVQFAQSQIIPAHPKKGDRQPTLTSLRKSLLLVQPLQSDTVTPMVVEARDGSGKLLGTLTLAPPSALPKTVYHLDGIPAGGISFIPKSGSSVLVRTSDELAKLSDKRGAFLKKRLTGHALVKIQTADGRWVRDIYLPQNRALEGKMVRVRSKATYKSIVFYGERQVTVSRGQTLKFKFANGQWFLEGELENNRITYASNTWSGELLAEWVRPGLRLSIRQGSLKGDLYDIKVGAPGELLLHTIDIGMLTTPRGRFDFANDKEAHREYFQTIPVSRLIVSQYAPLSLTEVMLPTGTLLTDFDPSKGGWHTGTMRQRIGKELISHGIDNANYGINSSAGEGEGSHPFVVAQLTAHNSRGSYANGIQVHGGSGGGGIVTLDNSLGNEFSHEVGHNFGLGHYVDGFRGSVHRSADQLNSSWGWDSDKHRFIPNFYPTRTNEAACLNDQCQPPFDGRKFGFDAMAGGSPFSGANRFTLYTPNSAAIIQEFLESKAVFDANSTTGFSKWNRAKARMEPYQHRVEGGEKVDAPMDALSEAALGNLLAEFRLIRVAMWDGRWTRDIRVPAAFADNRGRSLIIDHRATYNSRLFINGKEILVKRGFKKSFTSDGRSWVEAPLIDSSVSRKPEQLGIPVTTLVGYYDPQGVLSSYIYPALHGAYGFTYPDDGATLVGSDCQLQVKTRGGLQRFKLANHRAASTVMNKFHINVPTDLNPSQAAVVCNKRMIAKKALSSTPTGISFFVYGKALPAKAKVVQLQKTL